MWEALTDLTFEEWVYHIFDHPEAWYSGLETEFWDGPAVTTVTYTTRLFEDPIPPLEGFTDEELNRGMWYLVSNGGSGMLRALDDKSVSIAERVRCVESFSVLFEKLFVPRSSPYLSHLDEAGVAPLNSICYMWWDVLPQAGGPPDDALLGVVERELAISHPALQEGALHGLGHWQQHHPARITSIVDAYLARNADLNPELRAYALSARGGCVQ
jgi:hypothetical protein